MPSSRASRRAVFLWMRLNRLLLTRASRRAVSASALLSPPLRVARIDPAIAFAQRGDPGRQVVAEPDQQVGGRLGVGQRPMRLGELDAEEVRQRRQLVVLEIGIALAGDRQRVEVAARLEVRAIGERRLEEGQVEADRMADDDRVTDERECLPGGIGRLGRLLDVGVRDAVHLVADDRTTRVDEGGPAIGDRAALDLDRGDLEQIGHLRVGAGRLDVDDDELVTGGDADPRSRAPCRCRPRGRACSWPCRPRRGAAPGCR